MFPTIPDPFPIHVNCVDGFALSSFETLKRRLTGFEIVGFSNNTVPTITVGQYTIIQPAVPCTMLGGLSLLDHCNELLRKVSTDWDVDCIIADATAERWNIIHVMAASPDRHYWAARNVVHIWSTVVDLRNESQYERDFFENYEVLYQE